MLMPPFLLAKAAYPASKRRERNRQQKHCEVLERTLLHNGGDRHAGPRSCTLADMPGIALEVLLYAGP